MGLVLACTTGCILPPEGLPADVNVPPSFDPSERFPALPILRASAGESEITIPGMPQPGTCDSFTVGVRGVQDPDSGAVQIRWVKNNRSTDPNVLPGVLSSDRSQPSPAEPFDVTLRVLPRDDFENEVRRASFLGSVRSTLHLFITDAPAFVDPEQAFDLGQVIVPEAADPSDFAIVEAVWSLEFFRDSVESCPGVAP